MVQVRCECGQWLELEDHAAANPFLCPTCGRVNAPVAPSRVHPASAPRPPVGHDDDEIETLEVVRSPAPVPVHSRLEPTRAGEYEFVPPQEDVRFAPPVVPSARQPEAPPGPPCPACRTPLPAGARICTRCGTDLATGRPVNERETAVDRIVSSVSWFVPLGIFPIAPVDGENRSSPLVAWLIAVATVFVSAAFFVYVSADAAPEPAVVNLQLWVGDRAALEREDARIVEIMERRIKRLAQEQGRLTPDVEQDARRRATTMAVAYTGRPEGVGFRPHQLLTYALLHDTARTFSLVWHLGINLLFLLTFGLRLNAAIGNAKMAIVYPLLVALAAGAELAFNARQPMHPVVGASGAICGLAGMYAVLFAVRPIQLAAWVRAHTWLEYKTWAIAGAWMVVAWLFFNDIVPAMVEVRGEEVIVGHAMHAVVFGVGVVLAILMVAAGMVERDQCDLVTLLARRRPHTSSP